MPQFATINQTVETLKISRPTLYRKIKTREIPSVRVGKRVLIPFSFFKELEEKAISSASKTEA